MTRTRYQQKKASQRAALKKPASVTANASVKTDQVKSQNAAGYDDLVSIQQLQRSLGNRFVQRFISSSLQGAETTMPSAAGPEGGLLDEDMAGRIQNRRGMGTRLETNQKSKMEQAFEIDLDDVRLHTDQEADALSQSLNAKAFTIGSDIFFSRMASPGDSTLLAHELAHVIQQSTMTANGPLRVGAVDDPFEQQADCIAQQFKTPELAFKDVSTDDSDHATPEPQSNGLDSGTDKGHIAELAGSQNSGFSQTRDAVPLKSESISSSNHASHLQRDWTEMAGDVAGVLGLGNDIVSSYANLGPLTSNISTGLGGGAGIVGLGTGLMSLLGEDSSAGDRILGGMSTAGGIASLAGTASSIFGSGALSVGGATGLSATMGAATSSAGIAGLGTMGAGALATSGGAVLGAGAAGYGAGRLLDKGIGGLMNITGASDALDEARGISRPEGQHGDYSLSSMGADAMTFLDQANTDAMRAIGLFDEDRPAYTQTLGWRLGEILPSWMQ